MKDLLYDLAMALIAQNVPYIWGGKNPLVGFDCSGVVTYLLQSVGVGPDFGMSADGLYGFWKEHGTPCSPQLGALAFFGKAKAVHVAMCLDSKHMIEAAHGNENCRNRAVSALIGAYVRVSPLAHRNDLLAVITPTYDA